MSARQVFLTISVSTILAIAALGHFLSPTFFFAFLLAGPLIVIGLRDMLQSKHAILRNYPFVGHFRYLLESIRPEIQQYFVESNQDGRPFHREERSIIYQRAKGAMQTIPFGTQLDVYEPGYEFIGHSLAARHAPAEDRVLIGGPDCKQPYSSAHLNISAMSFGSLGKNAVRSLNLGAKMGGFAHNTGEGGISPYHLEHEGDLIWQIGTGYFGCRHKDGKFNPEMFKKNAERPSVKMIEIKLSQGAKPGHGGILPAKKVNAEVAEIRGVNIGEDVLSPPGHTAFTSPVEMMNFIAELRELSGGKPVGFKLCVGSRAEFLGLCLAMKKTGVAPDFISVDGGEGGTGAAPLEFSNRVGMPLEDGLHFVNNALIGFDLRKDVKILAAGKVATGFHILKLKALGADACNAARSMMFALGCIQARRCNHNDCPVGIATQQKGLGQAVNVKAKSQRVFEYQKETVEAFLELVGAVGLQSPHHVQPFHIRRRVSRDQVSHFGDLYPLMTPGQLLGGELPKGWELAMKRATPERFVFETFPLLAS